MSAAVVPFPNSRRQHFVRRQARIVAERSPDSGERHIALTLKIQREAMRRKGITEDVIERELRSLDAAIRTALWKVVFAPYGGDAA